MPQTASRRIRKAGATVVFVAVALGTTAEGAVAVDEFATPRPTPKSQVPIKTQATLGNRVSEVYVLRAPDVVGQPVGTARATLERSRLRAGRETTQLTSDRPAGTVLGQEPKAGMPVQPGAVVNLVVAAPPRVAMPAPSKNLPIEHVPAAPPQREVIVPNLIGQPAEAASAILAKPGLNLGERRRQDSDAPAGTVIAQLPAAGTRVHPGTSVNVTVAVENLVTVPDLIGATPQQAALALRRYQLGLGQQHERESSAPAGTVIRQAPAPGTRVARETRVNVLIATAPAPEPPPSRPRPPVVVPPPVVVVPPVIPPIVIQPPVPPVPPIVVAPPAPEPPVVAVPPAPPAPPVASEPQLPPAPPVAIAPQLPPPPAPPVVTVPQAPPAPAVATAPPAPAPVRRPAPKPQPTPQTRPTPTPAVPVPPAPPAPPAPPIVAQPPAPQPAPQPVRESPKRSWPSPIALGLGSVTLLGAAGTVYYRVRTTNLAHATPPNITYAAHWDLGSQQIEADAPLSRGAGLRLQAGFEAVTTTLETDHLVDQSHEMGGTR